MPEKRDWVIRVEGVNLGDTVFNTNDLSVIRGSSLCLEAFGWELEDYLGKSVSGFDAEANIIYRAASQAVFRFDNRTEAEIQGLTADIRGWLRAPYRQGDNDPPYVDRKELEAAKKRAEPKQLRFIKLPSEHMTFVVDHAAIPCDVEKADGERLAINMAMMRNRRRQMRSPNVPRAPGQALGAPAARRKQLLCPVDDKRQIDLDNPDAASFWVNEDRYPEAIVLEKKGRLKRIAASKRSADLRIYGRDARQTLYPVMMSQRKFAGLVNRGLFADPKAGVKTVRFATSFDDIRADPPEGLPPAVGGKLAYLYVDGNSFGKKRDESALRDFDQAVRGILAHYTYEMIGHFLDRADDPAYVLQQATDDPGDRYLRVETLIAGGDEFCVVLPGWLAWEMSGRILGWLDEAGQGQDVKLSYRAGLVICPAKSPFRRAVALAETLCKDAKRFYDGRDAEACLSFHVFESQDVPEEVSGPPLASLGVLRGPAYRGASGDHVDDAALAGAFRMSLRTFPERTRDFLSLKNSFPKSQLHKLIDDLGDVDSAKVAEPGNGTALDLIWRDFRNRTGSELTRDDVERKLPGSADLPTALRMKILADLWDYIDPLQFSLAEESDQ
ncbi:YbbR family protein [Rhodovulum sulfidophilum]|uniref:YbbR family protein n=1 Tax=Rhodovulum sulfidophilum TaxID=35806 RepID=A0A0D6B951_RHOSU|nr:YbbR family protein [Rhodovulum sulfidophilum]